MSNELLRAIDAKNDEYIKMWEDICSIESPTHDKKGVDAVGRYFIEYAKKHDWQVEIFPQPRAGDVITVTMNPTAKEAPIAISGHMDTVHEVGSFGTPPVRIEGDKIYGPGTTDCKGGIVAGFLAMDALQQIGFDKRPVVMYLQSDEEGGGKYSGDATINHICERAQGSVGFLNLEGGIAGTICVARKGIATFEFTVKGIETHSAGCADHGANAVLEAAYKIIELEKFKDRDGITCCCTLIKGGTKHNIVPGECKFSANVRFASKEQLDTFTRAAEAICKDIHVPGCTCEMVLPRVRPAMEANDQNVSLLNRLNEIWQANGLSKCEPHFGFGGSDAANVSAAGVPAVDNLGTFGGMIHTEKEYGILSSLASQAKRIALALYYI